MSGDDKCDKYFLREEIIADDHANFAASSHESNYDIKPSESSEDYDGTIEDITVTTPDNMSSNPDTISGKYSTNFSEASTASMIAISKLVGGSSGSDHEPIEDTKDSDLDNNPNLPSSNSKSWVNNIPNCMFWPSK